MEAAYRLKASGVDILTFPDSPSGRTRVDSVLMAEKVKQETGARILCGIMPLVSRRNALFMKNEIAGVPVTEELIERYPENATMEEGEAVGIAIAKEMMSYTESFVDGYYFSFPFNRVHMLEKILTKSTRVL